MNYLKKNKTFIIAEAGVNHNGSFKLAKQFIDVAKRIGADAIKFQTYDINKIYNKNFIKKTKITWAKKYILKKSSLINLKKYCKKKKIIFMSTPFESTSAILLKKIGMDLFKIASPSIYNLDLLKTISRFNKNIILSSGFADLNLLKKIKKKYFRNKNLAILYCVSKYPADIASIDLKNINILKKKLKCTVGFSDHFQGIEFSLLAKSYGAQIIEKHIKLSKKQKCPDSNISATPKEFEKMVKIIRKLDDKRIVKQKKLKPTVGIYYKKNLAKNEKLTFENIHFLMPNNKFDNSKIFQLLGKRAKKNLKQLNPINFKDF